ncbi:MAG: NAD(P)H-dependent glycerol-3-phosphate dehydrogenase [Actinobacteria bacterium]|nr:NAD(P)H-dependent glycerol-3-phosphate dehydrogenase [Actinomycetota bacterium]MTB28689.1 NAD(P)H-dependent glycerol-3-phosphate dehydrogenase [Actinomycetota bacterium]
MSRVATMGAGSWGSVFSMVMADAGSDVVIWSRDADVAAEINVSHTNSRYQADLTLPGSVRATTDAALALSGADIVVIALPAQVLRANLAQWQSLIPSSAILVSLIKGVELGTMLRMSEVIAQETGAVSERIVVVSGPNLAREIAQRQPSATTVACVDQDSARRLQDACTTDYFRPYWTTDVVGTEIGGAMKNVIAVANGMAVGMGLGENSQASLMTRGLAEIARLGVVLGADPLTFQGLAGVGDLVATCQSPLSRNRSFGESLGKGNTVAQTIAEMKQTCEAYKSCEPILELAKTHGVDMPITEQVVNVLHHGASVKTMAAAFMARDTKHEQESATAGALE